MYTSFILFLLCLVHGEIAYYASENGTRSWIQYSPISMSYGFNNSFILKSFRDSSSLDLAIMTCEDQYDTGNETCCVVVTRIGLHS